MLRSMKLSVAGLVVALLTPLAHADLLLEPYIGYQTGKWKQGTASEDMNGVIFGGRVGYQGLGFMAGLDYFTGKQTDESTPSNDVTPNDLAVFVGYNFPIMLRVYGAYGWDAKVKFSNNSGTNKYSGTSTKVGVGFTALPLVSINLEYYMGVFDKDNGSTMTTDLKTNMLGLTVSIPFKL